MAGPADRQREYATADMNVAGDDITGVRLAALSRPRDRRPVIRGS